MKAKIGDLQANLNILASQERLTELEMHHMRERIDLNDASIRQQHRAIDDRRLRPSLTMYEAILDLAIRKLKRREENKGNKPPESEAMRARRLRTDHDLDAYASDGKGPVPLEYWTTVSPAIDKAPMTANNLRKTLEQRRSGRPRPTWGSAAGESSDEEEKRANLLVRIENERATEDVSRPGPSGMHRRRSPTPSPPKQKAKQTPSTASTVQRMDTDESITSTESRGSRIKAPWSSNDEGSRITSPWSTASRESRASSPGSARSRSSFGSYMSSKQSSFSRPLTGVPLPPMLDHAQFQLHIDDPSLIGRSEIYVRRPNANPKCPLCGHEHRMYRCPKFLSHQLQHRWYHALQLGVCLNCLRPGHSSFKCLKEGACRRCGTRHNSLLCNRHPANK